jgi:TolB-like protein
MKRKLIFVVLFVFILTLQSYSQEKSRIAILDFKGKGVSEAAVTAVSDLIKSDIVNTGLFQVVERNQINEILKEQGFQKSGCTDQSCAVEIGKILSARKILIGEVTKVGQSIVITGRLVDVEGGIAEYAAKATAGSEDDLIPKSGEFSKNLIDWIKNKNAELPGNSNRYSQGDEALSKTEKYSRLGTPVQTYLVIGTGVSLITTCVLQYFFLKSRKEYRNSTTLGSIDDNFDKTQKLYWTRNSFAGTTVLLGLVTTAAYIFHWGEKGDTFAFYQSVPDYNFAYINSRTSEYSGYGLYILYSRKF